MPYMKRYKRYVKVSLHSRPKLLGGLSVESKSISADYLDLNRDHLMGP